MKKKPGPHHKLANGWTAGQGTICRFRHFSLDKAEEIMQACRDVHVVETINQTLVGQPGDEVFGSQVHHNLYFALSFQEAVGLAARMIIQFEIGQIAEDVVGIRPATGKEEELFWKASDHFDKLEPEGLSDKQTAAVKETIYCAQHKEEGEE